MKLALQLQDFSKPETWLRDFVARSRRVIDGHLGFGDGVDSDNIFGVWKTYTTKAVPDTEDVVVHNLGAIPIGYLVFSLDKGGVVYKSVTPWTSTQMFLKCTTATTTVLLFILAPSNKDF